MPTRVNDIFSDCVPSDLDSWRAEEWLSDFIKDKNNAKLAAKACEEFVEKKGIILDETLEYSGAE